MEVVVGFSWCICISGCFWWYVKMLTFFKKVHRNVIWGSGLTFAFLDLMWQMLLQMLSNFPSGNKALRSISFRRDRAEWDLPSEFWEVMGPSILLSDIINRKTKRGKRTGHVHAARGSYAIWETKPHDQKIIGKKTLGHSPPCSPLSIPVDHHLEKKSESEWKHAAPCMFIYWTFTVF